MPSIMIVDDSVTIRRVTRRILEGFNFQVKEAENGDDAISQIRGGAESENLPDALFVDIDMPVMDGMSFLKTLRDDDTFKDIVVIMCTSHNALTRIQEAVEIGANEYIMKPFTAEIVEEKLTLVGLL